MVPLIVNFVMLYTCMENRHEYARWKFEKSKNIGTELQKMQAAEKSNNDESEGEGSDEEMSPISGRPSVND